MTFSCKENIASSAKVQARSPAALFPENQEGAPTRRAGCQVLRGDLAAAFYPQISLPPLRPLPCQQHPLCAFPVPATPARKRGLPGWEGGPRLSLQLPDTSFIPAAESLLLHAGFVQLQRAQGSSLDAGFSLPWLLVADQGL